MTAEELPVQEEAAGLLRDADAAFAARDLAQAAVRQNPANAAARRECLELNALGRALRQRARQLLSDQQTKRPTDQQPTDPERENWTEPYNRFRD